jgi:tetraacyldisaccharide 4'-kinase
MQLEQRFTQAWAKQSAWLNLLRPLSSLYGLVINCRLTMFNHGGGVQAADWLT